MFQCKRVRVLEKTRIVLQYAYEKIRAYKIPILEYTHVRKKAYHKGCIIVYLHQKLILEEHAKKSTVQIGCWQFRMLTMFEHLLQKNSHISYLW